MKLKILLVDDEPFFLEQLRNLIDTCRQRVQADIEIVAECYSGYEAMQFIEEYEPDCVFTDIKMAAMDGLALSGAIHQRWSQVKTVIISGYPSFEYAREALRVQVYEYLLKPVKTNAIETLLNKLIEQKRAEQLRSMESKIHRYLQFRSTLSDDEFHALNTWVPKPNLFVIQRIHSAHDESMFLPLDPWEWREWTNQIASLPLCHENSWLFPVANNRYFLVIVKPLSNTESRLEEIGIQLQKCFSVGHLVPSLMIGEPLQNWTHLPDQALQLAKALTERLPIGDPLLLYQDRLVPIAMDLLPDAALRGVKLFCQERNWDKLRDLIAEILQQRERQSRSRFQLEQDLQAIAETVSPFLKSDPSQASLSDGIKEITHLAESYKELTQAYITFLLENVTAPGYSGDAEQSFLRMTAYIRENMSKPLSLQDLTRRFFVSSTTICNLFRLYGNTTFVEYVTRLRMEKAKELMRQAPHLLNKEIAERVGYSDQNYFSRVFKSFVGMSSTEYRNQCNLQIINAVKQQNESGNAHDPGKCRSGTFGDFHL